MKKIFSNKLLNNRRGVFSDIQMAILAVVSIALLVLFGNKIYGDMKEKIINGSCKDSIEAHRFLTSSTGGQVFIDIKCPTKEIKIKSLSSAKETIAEDMHRCWYIWNRGNGRYFEGEGTFCHICSVYRFDELEQNIDGMTKYLATTPMKYKYPGDPRGISYMDYFQGYETPNSAKMIGKNELQIVDDKDYIDTSQNYATIFVYYSGKDTITKLGESGAKITVATGGGLGIMMGIAAAGYGTVAAGTVISTVLATGGTVAITNLWNPIGWIATGVTLIGGGAYVIYLATSDADPEWMSFIVLRPYNQNELESLGCQKIDINQESSRLK